MNPKHLLRACSHPAALLLNGQTVKVEVVQVSPSETCVLLSDPNSGVCVASFTMHDSGPHDAQIRVHVGIRCSAREQGASYKRKGEK